MFPVAGRGTRFLPATKASPKEMLPIVDKPLIQYAAEEALAAGARKLVFITGSSKRAIEDHFDSDHELEEALEAQGKTDLLKALKDIVPSWASCIYIRQPSPLGLGHAVWCAKPVVGDEPFFVHLADDLIDAPTPCLRQMADVLRRARRQRARRRDGAARGDRQVRHRRDRRARGPRQPRQADRREAAAAECAFDARGRRALPAVADDLREARDRPDAAPAARSSSPTRSPTCCADEPVYAYEFEGKRYDCGSKLGYLQATVEYGLKHESLGEKFSEYLVELASKLK